MKSFIKTDTTSFFIVSVLCFQGYRFYIHTVSSLCGLEDARCGTFFFFF